MAEGIKICYEMQTALRNKNNIVILIEDGQHFESRVFVNEPPRALGM